MRPTSALSPLMTVATAYATTHDQVKVFRAGRSPKPMMVRKATMVAMYTCSGGVTVCVFRCRVSTFSSQYGAADDLIHRFSADEVR